MYYERNRFDQGQGPRICKDDRKIYRYINTMFLNHSGSGEFQIEKCKCFPCK